jgi:hypothetical protein
VNEKELLNEAIKLCEKFIEKVESGRARSVETYADMKQFLSDVKYYKEKDHGSTE